ncbi:MAG: fumarylacetoacetate hydrolase, partial [Methylobacteriaceae bacterium]|nr:fumarylacetoacetate hydrolase [Methylobacteriaceae bacterium]
MPIASITLDSGTTLPQDGFSGALAGRVWRPDLEGPAVVAIRADGVDDVTRSFPTIRDLCEADDPAGALRAAQGDHLGTLEALLRNTRPDGRDPNRPWFLAPIDLQAIKAAGV